VGRKPIGKRAMTDLERQQRRQAKLRPARQLARLTAAFIGAEANAREAFIRWLRKRKFLR